MAQHIESERGFGRFEIAISEEEQIFTYDLDENGGIINMERLEDSLAKREARLGPEPEEEEHVTQEAE